jgi:hypothetical protein
MKNNKNIIGVKNDPEEVKEDALGDNIIRKYLPNARIIKYSELKNFNNIEDLLPNEQSYCILLYESQPNSGHWTAIMRIDDNIEYFDSYGNKPDLPLTWSKNINASLGQSIPYLSQLLNKTNRNVFYNDFQYQKENRDIATCGRHCIFRILCLTKNYYNLKQYCNFIKGLKYKSNESYDDIVSYMINLIK